MIGTKVLEERKSEFNGNLRVVKTWGMGIYIQANGLTQSGGIVETIWKKTLSKIRSSPFTVHSSLILGLGGGTVAKLLRKNWPEVKITGVDIDSEMIELGKKYLGLDKSQVDIKITDALKFVTVHSSQSTVHYDLIIVDLYNGDKYPKKFESQSFLKKVYKISFVRGPLVKQNIVIFNRLYFGDKKKEADEFGRKLKKVFPIVEKFRPEANLMFFCRDLPC